MLFVTDTKVSFTQITILTVKTIVMLGVMLAQPGVPAFILLTLNSQFSFAILQLSNKSCQPLQKAGMDNYNLLFASKIAPLVPYLKEIGLNFFCTKSICKFRCPVDSVVTV